MSKQRLRPRDVRPRADPHPPRPASLATIAIALAVLTTLLYAPVAGFQFTSWDDPEYVTANPPVRAGLTASGLAWAFTSGHAANWHPLTWLSHMLDVQMFGMNPGAHHLTNVVIHALTTALLFLFFRAATGHTLRSAFIAALFAIHPAHVESVAWIAERKDVLSGLFFALTLLAYLSYTRNPSPVRYALVFLATAAGLMTKPMLVTLPFVLLLLDLWPLHRLLPDWRRRLLEKVPLLGLSLVSSIITFLVQQSGGAVARLDSVPIPTRIANALISYIQYLAEFLVPINLAVVYPYQPAQPLPALLAAILLTVATFFALRTRAARPHITVGWLWFVGMLVPVIGLVQVGSQTIADRYTYLPFIGLFVIIAWEFATVPKAAAAAVLVVAAMLTWNQLATWKDNLSLWSHALAVTADNYQAHASYAAALADAGQPRDAIRHYRESLRIKPGFPQAHTNLANVLARAGQREEAVKHYAASLRVNPNDPIAHNGMGAVLDDLGRLSESAAHFRQAVAIDPTYADGHNNLASVLIKQNRTEEALEELRIAARLRPETALYHFNLGQIYRQLGRPAEAQPELELAARLDPQFRR